MSPRPGGFRGEFLWELEIVERQLIALAGAIPEEQYDWRPHATARSVPEVFVHIATGNFMFLDVIGAPPPGDLYGEMTRKGMSACGHWCARMTNWARAFRQDFRRPFHVPRSYSLYPFGRNRVKPESGEESQLARSYLRLLWMEQTTVDMITSVACHICTEGSIGDK